MAFGAIPLVTAAVLVIHLVSDRWDISKTSYVVTNNFDVGCEDSLLESTLAGYVGSRREKEDGSWALGQWHSCTLNKYTVWDKLFKYLFEKDGLTKKCSSTTSRFWKISLKKRKISPQHLSEASLEKTRQPTDKYLQIMLEINKVQGKYIHPCWVFLIAI